MVNNIPVFTYSSLVHQEDRNPHLLLGNEGARMLVYFTV